MSFQDEITTIKWVSSSSEIWGNKVDGKTNRFATIAKSVTWQFGKSLQPLTSIGQSEHVNKSVYIITKLKWKKSTSFIFISDICSQFKCIGRINPQRAAQRNKQLLLFQRVCSNYNIRRYTDSITSHGLRILFCLLQFVLPARILFALVWFAFKNRPASESGQNLLNGVFPFVPRKLRLRNICNVKPTRRPLHFLSCKFSSPSSPLCHVLESTWS